MGDLVEILKAGAAFRDAKTKEARLLHEAEEAGLEPEKIVSNWLENSNSSAIEDNSIFFEIARCDKFARAKYRKEIVKKLVIRAKEYDDLLESAIRDLRKENEIEAPPPDVEALRLRAKRILEHPNPLDLVEEEIRASGFGGNTVTPLTVYIAATTRLLAVRHGAMPAHILLLGPAASGKSWSAKVVFRLLPKCAYHEIEAASPRVLIYDTAPLKHRVIFFGEADSLPASEDNPAASAIRNLLQDNFLHYQVTVKDEKSGFTVKKISKEGPTVLITTSTKRLGDQLSSRVFELEVADTQDQLRAALTAQAMLEENGAPEPDNALIAFQEYLQALAPWEVTVPFAKVLSDEIGRNPAAPRINRDYSRLLSAVKAVTVLQFPRRVRDGQGRLIAEVSDYKVIFDLFNDVYKTSASGAGKGVAEVVGAVTALLKQAAQRKPSDSLHVKVSEIVNYLKINKMSASRRVRKALRGGWLENREDRKGRAYKLMPGEALPDEPGLPKPEVIENAYKINNCNTVTHETAGKGAHTNNEEVVDIR